MRRVRHSLRPLPPVLLVAFVLESSIEVSEWNVRIDMRRRIRRQPNGLQNFMLSCILSSRFVGFNTILLSFQIFCLNITIHSHPLIHTRRLAALRLLMINVRFHKTLIR